MAETPLAPLSEAELDRINAEWGSTYVVNAADVQRVMAMAYDHARLTAERDAPAGRVAALAAALERAQQELIYFARLFGSYGYEQAAMLADSAASEAGRAWREEGDTDAA